MCAHVQKHKFRNVLLSKSYCVVVVFTLEKDSRESKSIEINHKLKILIVVFMLLFMHIPYIKLSTAYKVCEWLKQLIFMKQSVNKRR